MAHRSSPRRFRSSGVGSYTAMSSRPFNDRFFEELDARLAREEAAGATAPLTVAAAEVDPFRAALHALKLSPVRA